MATVHAGMAMSLDGFVADRIGGTARLSGPATRRGSAYMTALIQATGGVVMGRRSFAMAEDPDWYVGNYEFQVPIFVLTHQPSPIMPKQGKHLTFTFVTDGVASAIAKAKARWPTRCRAGQALHPRRDAGRVRTDPQHPRGQIFG